MKGQNRKFKSAGWNGFVRYRRLNHAGTVIAIASGYDVAVNDMSCLMNRSAELRMRTVDIERVRERGRMER